MPNIKSAIKRVRSSEAKAVANRAKKSETRTAVKKALAAIESGSDQAADLVKETQKTIDQAKAKGRLHRNTAARRTSRLARRINKVNSENSGA